MCRYKNIWVTYFCLQAYVKYTLTRLVESLPRQITQTTIPTIIMDCLQAIQLHPAMQIFLCETKLPWKKQKAARTSTRRYWRAILSPLPSNKDTAEFSIDL